MSVTFIINNIILPYELIRHLSTDMVHFIVKKTPSFKDLGMNSHLKTLDLLKGKYYSEF